MKIVGQEAANEARVVAILGAQGARVDPETGMRQLSPPGLARIAIAGSVIDQAPEAEGYILNMAGWGQYSGGGLQPEYFEETEAAATQIALQGDLTARKRSQHKWSMVTGAGERGADTPIAERFAGSTIHEVALILAALHSMTLRGERAESAKTHIIAGREQLARVSDILNALNDPLAKTMVGVVNEGETNGFKEATMAAVTRWVYRGVVLRGARKSLSADELLQRERKTVGRAFEGIGAVKGMAKQLAGQLKRANSSQGIGG